MWDSADPAHLRPLGHPLADGGNALIGLVAFSPDGRTLASGNGDMVQLWNVAAPAQPQLLSQPLSGTSNGGIDAVAFSPDGRTLATGEADGTIQVWNIPRTILTGSGNGGVDSMAFSPDGRIMASDNNGVIQLWDVASASVVRPLGRLRAAREHRFTSVRFSPNSDMLATHEISNQFTDDSVQLWNVTDAARPQPIGTPLTGTNGMVNSTAFSPDSRTLAIGDDSGTIQLRNTDDPARPQPGKNIPTSNGDQFGVASMAFSPDGHILASVDFSGTIQLWTALGPLGRPPLGAATDTNASSGIQLALQSVAYSADDRTLALLIGDGTVDLWDVSNPADPEATRPTTHAPCRLGQFHRVRLARHSGHWR